MLISRVILTTAFLSATAAIADDLHWKREREAQESSSLLASGQGYAIHLIAGGMMADRGGYAIAHFRGNGETLTWLYRSGVSAQPTVRISYRYKRLCGILVARDALYLLVYESPRIFTDDDRVPDSQKLQTYLRPIAVQGHFLLLAFDLASGRQLGQYSFEGELSKPPFVAYLYSQPMDKTVFTYDHLGGTPFAERQGAVLCFGRMFKLEGGKLSVMQIDAVKEATEEGAPANGASPRR